MTPLRIWFARLSGLFRRPSRDRALDDEIQGHLDDLTDDLVDSGMSRSNAVAEARRQFGGVDQVKEMYRDQRGWPSVDWLRQDIGLALHRLRTQPASTLLAVLSLGLGIGVSMGFFTIVNAICLRGLPIDRPERVLFLGTRDREARPAGVSYADFLDFRRNVPSFSGVAAYGSAPFNVADDREAAERIAGSYISGGAFRVLGIVPIVGREIEPADEVAGAPAVVVIGHAVWMSRYGGDPTVIGRSLRINGTPAAIVGVMPEGFLFPGQANAWLPITAMPGLTTEPRTTRRLAAFGRIADDRTSTGAHEALTALARRLQSQYPESNSDIIFSAIPINEQFNGNVTSPVWIAFLTSGLLVLLVACANVANLQLARLAARSREVALRLALGATRLRIFRQLLVESLVLAGLGGVAGLALAVGAVRLLAWSVPASSPLPYWITFAVDSRVLAALLATCVTSVVFFGMVPAVHAARVGVNAVLKDDGRHATAGRRTRRWSAAFVVVQFALTLVLLANVAMDLRQTSTSARESIEIDPAHLLTARVTLPPSNYGSPEERQRFFQDLEERARQTGRVASMTVAGQLPPEGGAPRRLRLPDQMLGPGELGEPVFATSVGNSYFETLGVPLVQGRDLTVDDSTAGREGVVVNEDFVARLFSGRSAVGERIALIDDGQEEATPVWRTIVGVAPSLRQGPLTRPLVYLPNQTSPPSSAVLIVRATESPGAAVPAIREAAAALDPDLPVYRMIPLEAARHDASWNGRVSSGMLRAISGIALLLALVGLYAVTAHAVTQRTHEIGIRVALGATPGRVSRLVLRRALSHVAIGLAVGLPATYAFDRLFIDPTVSASLTAPANVLPVLSLVVAVAIVACAWPAARAARLGPSRTLSAD